MLPLRLKPGFLLFPGPGGTWCLHGPGDRLIRLLEEPARIARLAEHLTAEPQDDPPAGDVADLIAAFQSYGLIEPPVQPSSPSPRRVAVLGDGPVAARVRELLGATAAALPGADLLIACAGWLPDAQWRELDAWCADHRMPWHRVNQEGTAVHLGPLSLPGTTASYADTRARRLAVTPFPEELEALWRHLDGGAGVPDPPPLSPAAAAVAAGLLVVDVQAWLEGTPIPSLGHAVEIDLLTLTVRRRPVLPVPRGAATEGPA